MVGKNQAPDVVSQEKKSKGMGNIVVIWARAGPGACPSKPAVARAGNLRQDRMLVLLMLTPKRDVSGTDEVAQRDRSDFGQ
ncbi:hypothetical protein N7537_000767 [Penicillium hordei]|uniref:Uncharacterized protein n=1 Tax=Penicillium hordei TaxID=40994 RepID=A0AAD6EEK4_9EURO|nr:uncharacterized protein N7537_000767 [Penicillium hordei]KAJ5615653.1 hypothetical protein N7537_000767 [Penicillium hordei]